MGIEIIKCPVCGYSANYVSFGGKGNISTDVIEMMQTCKNYGSGQSGLGCKHFDDALLKPQSVR